MSPDTVLLRQAHPNFVPDGKISSQAFMPFPKDNGMPSVYDGDQISAAESHHHFTQVLNNLSIGVWGVTCSEVTAAGLTSRPDPLENFPAHAIIDFCAHPEKHFRKLAKKLRASAEERGCLYIPG